MIASTFGSFFAIFGDTLWASEHELSIGWTDAAGLALAFLSFMCAALGVLLIRRIGADEEVTTPDTVVVFWVNVGCALGAAPTFIVDNW